MMIPKKCKCVLKKDIYIYMLSWQDTADGIDTDDEEARAL